MNPGYEEHLDRVRQRRERLADGLQRMFPEPQRLTLEIGCGHGHWLVGYGAAMPDRFCLGIDIIGDRINRAERKRDRAGLDNVRFLRGEAWEVLDLLPSYVVLEEVFILFPDPWPKKRHWKNRLFSKQFLEELGQRCRNGVRCCFRTDHEGYFDWAKEAVDAQGLWRLAEGEQALWPYEEETVFQSKAASYQSLILVKA